MLGTTNQIFKKLVYAGIVASILLAGTADKALSAPDSNSIVIDDIEFYVETDKSIYYLGENVEMLYRLTKLGPPSATILCHQDPPLNLVVLKDGKTVWMKVQGWWQVMVNLQLFPNIPVEITSSWDMNDVNCVPVGPGTYEVLGVIYDTIGIPDVGVRITILPIPRTITVGLGAGYDFNTIQAAIDDAYDGDTIIVADGIYTGDGNRDIDFLGKAITLRSENGPENCIIDCNGTLAEKHRGFYFHSQEDSNSVLAGFTVTNGHGLLWYPFPVPAGGAIFCKNSSPRIANCIIKKSTGGFGGGILCHSSSPVISDCTVSSNSAVEGGGMYNYENSCVELINCTFSDNFVSSDGRGGGIVNMQSNPVIRRCVFVNNYGGAAGGGVCNLDCIPTFTDCRFIGNSAPVLLLSGRCGGGGVYNAGSSPSMTNCIFSGNHGSGGDAMSNASSQPILTNCTFTGSRFTAIYNWRENINLTLRNCILWDQTENEINDSNVIITYSNVKGGWPGLGNIDADPCFADQGYWDDPCNTPGDFWDDVWIDGDYHLKSEAGRWEPNSKSWVQDNVTSPCIDAGNPGCPLGDEPGPNGNRRNMGAYGGTAEASKSPINWRSIADLTNDWILDSNDLKVFVGYWLETGECIPSDLNRNQSTNSVDFALLALNWLDDYRVPDFYYYSSGRKIPLILHKDKLVVRFKQGVTLEQQLDIVFSEEDLMRYLDREMLSIFDLIMLFFREGVTERGVMKTINSLNIWSEVEFANPFFHTPDAPSTEFELTLTDEFSVKFDPSVSQAEIEAFNTLHNVEIVTGPSSSGSYLLRVQNAKNINTLKTANRYYEDLITVYSVPNFVMRMPYP